MTSDPGGSGNVCQSSSSSGSSSSSSDGSDSVCSCSACEKSDDDEKETGPKKHSPIKHNPNKAVTNQIPTPKKNDQQKGSLSDNSTRQLEVCSTVTAGFSQQKNSIISQIHPNPLLP